MSAKKEISVHGTVRPISFCGQSVSVLVDGNLDLVKSDTFSSIEPGSWVEAQGQWLTGWNFSVSRWRTLDSAGKPSGDWRAAA